MAAGSFAVVDSRPVDSPAAAGSRLAGSQVVGSHLVDNLAAGSRLVVVHSLVVVPAVADNLLVAQVD